MKTTVQEIGKEIHEIIDSKEFSKNDSINDFLDRVNNLRGLLNTKIMLLKELDSLFSKLTFLDVNTSNEKKLVRLVLDHTKEFHKQQMKHYANTNRVCRKLGVCNNEVRSYKSALDDLKDTVLQTETIFFTLREDKEFIDLIRSI